MQQADDAPKLLVLGVELARKVAHGALDRLAMGDVERVLVVLVEQFERAVAGDSGGKRLCHKRLLVLVGIAKNEYYWNKKTTTKVPVPFVVVFGADGLVEGGLG